MCGFGDKDRRPITPPPCIELVIRDAETGQRIDPNDIDSTYFVLTVDLWDKDANAEVNLVRHSGNSPAVSISTSTTSPYPPPPERAYAFTGAGMMYGGGGYPQGSMAPGYGSYGAGFPAPMGGYTAPLVTMPTHPVSGMFTRNLIGSLSVNAFKLTDTESKTGFWFILQDLSVRTEGMFRLKMNFVDVGEEMSNGGLGLNKGKANVLATAFSETFQVYSAKKFPGVIESTPLSKSFASQGIKIPIRKDGPKDGEGGGGGGKKDEDYDGDD
ncbi:hypothetical protein LTS18_000263 [Coniosporium uncinatum]|uniref:Uncharacterized protein n=1 Tax=Coniosporium uncinatum TaxID=93489 RepID=A0ACC3DVI2_9PEZI|nr:hypothetical protein LTS18_000263 [Coniosporium uncinatum]